MRTLPAVLLTLACAPALAQSGLQECRVLIAKDWIEMGATTLTGCFQFADEAATPGERQFAKLGDKFLKVEGGGHYQSADGGNTWEAVAAQQAAVGFSSLNRLEASDQRTIEPAPEGIEKPAPVGKTVSKKKKKRKKHRRSTYSH